MEPGQLLLGDVLRKYGPEAFGTLGALVGLSFIEKLNAITALVAFVVGVAFATLGAPVVLHYVEPPEAIRYHVAGFAGLVLGISGFFLAGAISNTASTLRDTVPGVVKTFIEKWSQKFGGKE